MIAIYALSIVGGIAAIGGVVVRGGASARIQLALSGLAGFGLAGMASTFAGRSSPTSLVAAVVGAGFGVVTARVLGAGGEA